MNLPFLVLSVVIVLLGAMPLYRVVAGPTVFDRVIGAGMIGTKTLLLLAVIGFAYGRIEMFVDLAVVYALLNFVGTIATGKYLERQRGKTT